MYYTLLQNSIDLILNLSINYNLLLMFNLTNYFFQLRDMEHIMCILPLRQLQSIRRCTNLLQNFKGANQIVDSFLVPARNGRFLVASLATYLTS